MRRDFEKITEERKLKRRRDAIAYAMSSIKDDIENCMAQEIDLLPDDFPPDLVEMLAALHSRLASLGVKTE